MAAPRSCPEDRLILLVCRSSPDYGAVLRQLGDEPVRWRSLVQTARVHRVAPLVLDRLLGLELPPDARAALQEVGKREIASVTRDNAVFRSELRRVLAKLRADRLETILLKGLSLDVHGLRQMSDLDLMVPESRLADAIDALLSIDGYSYRRMRKDGPDEAVCFRQRLPSTERRRVQAELGWNNEFHLRNSANGVLVELHHRPFLIRNPDGRFVENTDGVARNTPLFWQHRQWDPVLGCFTLSAAHAVVLASLRTAIKQQPAGEGLRLCNLVDIDNLAAAGLPWPQVVRDCRTLAAAPFVLFSLALARRLLGTPVPPRCCGSLPRRARRCSCARCPSTAGASSAWARAARSTPRSTGRKARSLSAAPCATSFGGWC